MLQLSVLTDLTLLCKAGLNDHVAITLACSLTCLQGISLE
jgi:hypothetical protein